MEPIAYSKTISEAFLKRCKHNVNKVGFRYKKNGEWHSVTFGEQFNTIRNIACGLMRLGVAKGDKVSIMANTAIEWGQFDIAILGCGGITIPIYPTNTPEDVQYIINHSEVKLVFVDNYPNLVKLAGISKNCPNLKTVVVNFDVDGGVKADFQIVPWREIHDEGLNHQAKLAAQFEKNLSSTKPDDVFTICYTSGTTGLPKGAVLPHSCMHSTMEDVYKALFLPGHLNENEHMLSFLPMSHIFGKWESMTPYYYGWTQSFAESIDALVGNLGEERPTLWIAVPRVFEKAYAKIIQMVNESPAARQKVFKWAVATGAKYLQEKAKGSASLTTQVQYTLAKKLVFQKIANRFGGNLRLCVSGSAPLAQVIQEFFHMAGVPIYEGYGLTETCAPVAVNTPGANKFGTVGKVLPEVLVKIAEDGEILIKSQKNFREYYKNPEATAEAIRDGWFYTGDIGHLDGDGYLKITDRKKDLIKTAGGKFVAPQKIENAAKSFSLLNQIVVYGDQKPYCVALITLQQEAVIQYAKEHGIIFGEYADLLKKEEIKKLVAGVIEELNSKLAKWETIKKYHVIPRDLTVESGELTPSLKVKRKFLSEKFKKEIDAIYAE